MKFTRNILVESTNFLSPSPPAPRRTSARLCTSPWSRWRVASPMAVPWSTSQARVHSFIALMEWMSVSQNIWLPDTREPLFSKWRNGNINIGNCIASNLVHRSRGYCSKTMSSDSFRSGIQVGGRKQYKHLQCFKLLLHSLFTSFQGTTPTSEKI